MELLKRMLAGDRVALAKLMTMVENRSADITRIMAEIHPRLGKARRIGVTGPPGAGKSTLVDKLIGVLRDKKMSVGVVAVDPSSPFTGGAVLGDRVRMMRHATDDEVFIRSLGSRGSHGGLSRATREITSLYDAFGKDVIIIETVGVGQTELDIMELADTTIVVLVPESGDTIQTMKAGITEIADIFVINKADREGADRIRSEITAMVELDHPGQEGWTKPVVKTIASKNEGVKELYDFIAQHQDYQKKQSRPKRDRWSMLCHEIRDLLVERFEGGLADKIEKGLLEGFRDELLTGKINPYSAAMRIMEDPELAKDIFSQDKLEKK